MSDPLRKHVRYLALCIALSLGALSTLVTCSRSTVEKVAQWVITSTRNRKVPGSTPSLTQLMNRDTAKQACPEVNVTNSL